MASVQIADIYNPIIWDKSVQEAAVEQNRFLASGIMVSNGDISAMASGSSTIGELPFFKGLTNDEPNYSNDVSTDLAVPAKITGAKQAYRKFFGHKSWATMDIAREIAAVDPVAAITGRIGKYWAVNTEKRLINSLTGIMLDNVANDAADMVISVATLETGAAPAADKIINPTLVINAAATMGDQSTNLNAIAMHSVPFANLQRLNLIVYLPFTDQSVKIPTYLGYRVIVDDSLPVRAGTISGFVYTSILFGSDVVGFGSGSPEMPSELERVPGAGKGGGQDIIHSRVTEIIHPFGFTFVGGTVVGQSATYAELATATNWDRVYASRKNIPLAFIRTNG